MRRTLKQAVLHERDKQLRAELQAQRDALAGYIRTLKEQRKGAVAKARAHCKASRARTNQRAKVIRVEHRMLAQKEIDQLRAAAKRACAKRVSAAKRRGATDEQSAAQRRKEAAYEQRRINEVKRLDAKRSKTKATRAEQRAESDDEVRRNISEELWPVWRQVKATLPKRGRISRTEAFLQWVEENPDEVIALQHPDFDAKAIEREAKAELARIERALRKGQLRANDWAALGTSPDELRAVGLDPESPDDVLAFLGGYAQHWQDMAGEVPF